MVFGRTGIQGHAARSSRRPQSGGDIMNQRGSIACLRVQKALWRLCLSLLFTLATALLLTLLPVFIFVSLRRHMAERRFRWRLQRWGRQRPWAEIRVNMASRQGTLVLEADRAGGQIRRVWWVRDHLLKLFPQAPWASLEDLRRLGNDHEPVFEPRASCREWCEHFLPDFADAAVLTRVTPELLWSYLSSPICATHAVAVVPFPALTYRLKRAH